MKRATHATLEIRAIMKDACTFVGGCDVTAVFFFAKPFVILAAFKVLPVLWC